jgi:NADH-quinone oxidoreductase subunit G
VVTPGPVREDQFATCSLRAAPGEELTVVESLAQELRGAGRGLVILFGDAVRGGEVRRLVAFGDSLGVPVQYVCLVDYSNSRGAADMGLMPELLPGYRPAPEGGMTLPEMLVAEDLGALWVVGANPLRRGRLRASRAFVVVQDMFLTETAQNADIVLPAASAYEKRGTLTSVCGEVQRVSRALEVMGVKSDLEIFGLLAQAMGIDAGMANPGAVWEEIRRTVPGYNVPEPILATGGAVPTGPPPETARPGRDASLVRSAGDTLFTSGTLSRYCGVLNAVIESPGSLYGRRGEPR